jgi:hypothetical protein
VAFIIYIEGKLSFVPAIIPAEIFMAPVVVAVKTLSVISYTVPVIIGLAIPVIVHVVVPSSVKGCTTKLGPVKIIVNIWARCANFVVAC